MARDRNDPESIDLRKAVGCRLRALREALDLSQRAFAKNIGDTQSTYHKWEGGSLFPNPVAMVKVYIRYNVDFNFIYLGDCEGLSGNLAAQIAIRLDPKYLKT